MYVSNADPVDFGLDIVVRDGEDVTKRGKLPGLKRVAYENGEQVIEPVREPDAGRFERRVDDGEVFSVDTVEDAHTTLQQATVKLETEEVL